MELILIIVVLVLLFGGGGGILGSQSRLLVTVRFGQSCVCHTDSGALSFAVTAWPLHDRVVVTRIDAEDKTAGGIIIPDTAKEKPF